MGHRLDPLLCPRSIAVVGATRQPGKVGNDIVRNLLHSGFPGPLYAVNPRYTDVEGVPCYPAPGALPEAVDQMIFAINDEQIESTLEAALQTGIKSCVIYSSLVLEEDSTPPLRERIAALIDQAGIPVCGANSMGYYNFRDRIWACGFETRSHRQDGHITLISQSGAGMSGILDVDQRLDFNFAVSTGQELAVSLEDYLDWALDQPETRVVGLFVEAARHPAHFIAALEKANARRIPVVAIKVGRTDLAAHLAVSHCGALAGTDSVYDAVFDRYGVQRVADMDALCNALLLFAQPHPVGAGGLVTLHDSGGERQLLIDLADRHGVRLARIGEDTRRRLEDLLDPGLAAVNPLDAWSAGGPDSKQNMEDCFAALMSDPDAAVGAVIHDRGPEGRIEPDYIDYLHKGHNASGKPACLVAARQGTGADPRVMETTRTGFPVLDGVPAFLEGVRCLLDYRDFLQQQPAAPPELRQDVRERWRARLAAAAPLAETQALEFLGDCGIPVVAAHQADSKEALADLLPQLEFPLVLKTAAPGIAHKSDAGGVHLNIHNPAALLECYRELSERLGPRVTVAPMIVDTGVEMILGMNVDPQFGPVVVMGIGGIHAELLEDVVTAVPPFDAATARRLLDRLSLRGLLDGTRGSTPVDVVPVSATASGYVRVGRGQRLNPVRPGTYSCAVIRYGK
ncbi:MAG: acetate--CoA ligase family protein [Gammaproteobacteria bacterium]